MTITLPRLSAEPGTGQDPGGFLAATAGNSGTIYDTIRIEWNGLNADSRRRR